MGDASLVVGVDMSAESASALAAALQLGDRLGQRVTVVHAVGLLEESGFRAAPAVDELVASARAAAGVGDHVVVEVLREDGPAAEVLVRVAERLAAAMIVVGRRGSDAAPRPLGSVSEAVLAHAHVPVLIVPLPPA